MAPKSKYGFRVVWSEEDQEFVATVPEFAGLSALGETPAEALAEAEAALDGFLETYYSRGIPLPEPIAERPYSGQVRLRMPKGMHARATALAEQEGVSLNHFLVAATAIQVGAAEQCNDFVTQIVGRVIELLRDELVVKTAVHALSVALSPPNVGIGEQQVAGSNLVLVREGGILTAKESDIHGGG
ncbi:MAG: toxin-antitoxin system HicB family antitoxin [Blastocatellia bacterium]